MSEETVVYYKPGCPFGIKLRAALTVHRVPFTSVRFRDDEAGAAQVRAVNDGNEISPTVRVNGSWLTNPHWREVLGAYCAPPRRRAPAAEQTVRLAATFGTASRSLPSALVFEHMFD